MQHAAQREIPNIELSIWVGMKVLPLATIPDLLLK